MKKYVAIAVCAIIAGVATAGTVRWQCFEGDAGLQEGYVAYLFEGTPSSDLSDSIIGGTFTGTGNLASAFADQYGEIDKPSIGSYVSTDVTLYMVVFDAGSISEAKNFAISEPVTQSFGSSGNRNFNFTDKITSSSWTPIPEPTSVALLALGLAAIGLKRKVA